jgi:hypothetical protein
MAEQLLPIAAQLAVLVHGDGGPQDVQAVLEQLDEAQRTALIVVLAGLVDPEQPMGKALGWLDFDEHGDLTVPAGWGDARTVRDMAPDPVLEDEDAYVDPVAVRLYVDGKPVAVSARERLEAIAVGVKRGMKYPDFDRMHGLSAGSTSTFISRTRRAYEQRGEPFPALERPDAPAPVLEDAVVVQIRERYAAGGVTDMELALAHGVTRNTITNLLNGTSYRQAGGPIRPKRTKNKPGVATRTVWGTSTPGFHGIDEETKEVAA